MEDKKSQSPEIEQKGPRFQFIKGGADIFGSIADEDFNWKSSATKTREQLGDAMNARHLSFLFGSGCSSLRRNGEEVGIPTMAPLAKEFLANDKKVVEGFPTKEEQESIKKCLGIDIKSDEYAKNLERLMEVLFSARFLLKRSADASLLNCSKKVDSLIKKVADFICQKCSDPKLTSASSPVISLYQAFYRQLMFRDRSLPQPWIFTTNYDLFNEIALDRLGTPYCNGFSGTHERRFNPATYRYSLAEQLDISNRKWTSVDGYLYLCKLHGSINWTEDGYGLFPIREVMNSSETGESVMIYPTPTKQNASFGSPYSDLFREFQSHVVRDQSVLVVLGYSFGDEHVNNLIFQALTVPTFRLVAFIDVSAAGTVRKLKELNDPRIWLIGGDSIEKGQKAHYFENFIRHFMPDPPENKVETAIENVVANLLGRTPTPNQPGVVNEE